jgi:hypothetical protein
MRSVLWCVVLACCAQWGAVCAELPNESAGKPPASMFTLAKEGRPACSIVTAANPTPAARLAAMELQFHVLKITGAELPIRTDSVAVRGARILVGESAATRAMGYHGSDFAPQEYLVAFRPDTLILMGRDWEDTDANRKELGRPMSCGETLADTRHKIDYWKTVGMPERSTGEMELPGIYDDQATCYAAYHFIEEFCGVRWYGATQPSIIIPSQKTLAVSGADVRRSPALKYRDYLCGGGWPFMSGQWGPVTGEESRLFWRRMRLGGEKWAGNHTFNRKTFDTVFTDPEYQAQGPGKGKQLCYTNPKLIGQVAQMARDYFDGKQATPEGWKAVGNYFAIIPDDNSNFCRCDRCRELITSGRGMKTGQFSSGSISNYFFSFVNAVAREVAKTHPDKYIATLAYWNYAYPPSTFEMEPNVSMAPCLHTCMYAIHKEMRENDMKLYHEWLQKTKAPLYLWNYYHHPMEPALIDKFNCFPNIMPHSSVESARMFIKDGVRGIFICGQQDMLESYLIMRIWDDPGQDVDAMMDEFFQRYFGAAAKPMKAFYLELESIATNPENYPEPYYKKNAIDWKNVAWTSLGTEPRMRELGAFMDEAQAMAQTGLEKQRVGLWRDAIWKWMQEGRAEYLSKSDNNPAEAGK